MAIRLLRMSDGGASLASLLAWVFVSFSRGIYWRFVFFFFSESCVLFALALERGVGAFSYFIPGVISMSSTSYLEFVVCFCEWVSSGLFAYQCLYTVR
jgi:hypothetical protein